MELHEKVQAILDQPDSVNARAALAWSLQQQGHPDADLVWSTASHIAAAKGDFFSALALARLHLDGLALKHQLTKLAAYFGNNEEGCSISTPHTYTPPINLTLPQEPDALMPLAIRIGASAPSLVRAPNTPPLELPIFGKLSPEEFLTLASQTEPIHLNPGDELVCQGEREQALYFVSHGQLTVHQHRGGMMIHLANVSAPTLIGEMSLISSLPHRATVQTETAALAWRIHAELLAELTTNHPYLIKQIHHLIERRQIKNLLNTSPVLHAIHDKERLLKTFSLKHINLDEEVISQGTQPPGLFLILYGEAIVFTQSADGRRIRVADLAEGDSFGEMSLLSGMPTEASIWMKDGGTLLHLSPEHYQELLIDFPELEKELKQITSDREQELRRLLDPMDSHHSLEDLDASWLLFDTEDLTNKIKP
ncbi:MAG: hypothetical protein CL920_01420 [Deltaproteobacteria bacterium]|mgnify:CR=1 FL=1|nr:hypothetical protein [Deltaproteobacteria bacterium]MBU47341.1 hypothetical protein [Deltaproteobacteria bacterium]|tara:strand:+ start:17161 stop:18429 length:1269 start_codon:yes stop_codon:yes gene_type:complete